MSSFKGKIAVVTGGAKPMWLLSRSSPTAAVWFWQRFFVRRRRALRTPDSRAERATSAPVS